MRKSSKLISISMILVILICVGLLIYYISYPGFHKNAGPGKNKGIKTIEKSNFIPDSNPTYKNTCGGCHFPYPAELLPATSWKTILEHPEKHFGKQVPLDTKSREEILNYLSKNGADRSSSRKSIKIMESLKGKTPLRITEIPYIKINHQGIKPKTFGRKSIGSFSNCIACHRTPQGNFNEYAVSIPD